MTLQATQLVGFTGHSSSAASIATIEFTASVVDAVDRTTYTFSTVAIGTAGANRHVAVSVHASDLSGSTGITSVTIGGVGATQVVIQAGDIAGVSFTTAIYIAAVPTGATGDVVVVFAGGRSRCGIGVWAVYDLLSATAVDTQVKTSVVAAVAFPALATDADGVAIFAVGSGGTTTHSWSSATEDFDEAVEAGQSHSGASISTTGASISETVTASGDTEQAGVCASFR